MKKQDTLIMRENDILSAARSCKGMTQAAIGKKLNMLQNAVSMNMSRKRISLEMFARLLDAMGYDVVVVDRDDGSAKWKVEVEK